MNSFSIVYMAKVGYQYSSPRISTSCQHIAYQVMRILTTYNRERIHFHTEKKTENKCVLIFGY